MEFIDLKTQQARIAEPLRARIDAVLAHGQYIMGPEVAELEARLAAFAGSSHCIGVANGTDSLMIALMALGIGAGDEVITSPFTFISTGEMIALVGATPVFVDIDAETYNLDPAKLDAAISPKTRAIMPVSLYGQCADMDAINSIAARHGIAVIEDAAQSFGAMHQGRKSCALSTIGSTSFFPSKPLGCYGDGGALFTDDAALAKRMREIRVHGQDRRYHHPIIGMNGRLDTLQAAILLAKLDIFDDEVAARARIGARYSELLSSIVRVPVIQPGNTSVFAQYTIEVDNRDAFMAAMKASDIPTTVHYPIPLHLQPAFSGLGLGRGHFPVSEAAADRVVSLPMHPYLTVTDQNHICAAVADWVQSARAAA
jgi:UDP-2-acetamido-2-deoxy-ribo-hexuluronate aminotransferase